MKKVIISILVVLSIFVTSSSWAQELQSKSAAGLAASNAGRENFYPSGTSPDAKLPALPKGPLLLSGTASEQLSPDYWINRLPNPDRILKTPEQLKFFNKEIRMMIHERVDIFQAGVLPSGTQIRNQIKLEYETISKRKLFNVNDQYIPKDVFPTQIKPLVQWEQVPSTMTIKWGAATRATSVRALPTTMKMLEEKGDIEFDQLQFTLIKLWTPVAVFHTSTDGKWYYVQAPYVRGWVRARDIAIFPSRKALQEKAGSDSFLAVTGESVPVCFDPNCQEVFQSPSMGTILPLVRKTEAAYVVEMPLRASSGKVILKNYYVQTSSDVSKGFL